VLRGDERVDEAAVFLLRKAGRGWERTLPRLREKWDESQSAQCK